MAAGVESNMRPGERVTARRAYAQPVADSGEHVRSSVQFGL
ncbi:hypothetical protein [Verrucosispora sp. FIM060022]|nr:hypothetical protein [Verrucosispora sp. FIM060022]